MPKAPKATPALSIDWLPTDQLIPYANNAKQHPAEQVSQIAASIQAFGFNDPIAVDGDCVVIEGHGRLLAALKLGLETVPVIQLGHLTEAQKKAYILAHNKLCLNTGWDLDLLRVEFESLQELAFDDLSLTGFGAAEIEMLFTTPSIPDTEPDLDEGILSEKESTPQKVTCPACGEEFHV